MATEMQGGQTGDGVLTSEEMLRHWQGHRRLTRRTIELFPEDKLFSYSIGGMRPFGAMCGEILAMGTPLAKGLATGEWSTFEHVRPETKEELLRAWDGVTGELDAIVPTITPEQFRAMHKAFGLWDARGVEWIEYAVENEVHHRGQGFVYLRTLGIAPPPFWERE